jgi:hypothetical protein
MWKRMNQPPETGDKTCERVLLRLVSNSINHRAGGGIPEFEKSFLWQQLSNTAQSPPLDG